MPNDKNNNEVNLSDEQKKQLELARNIFRGKKLVLHGGAWTAEAREPSRQTAVLDQLELAHELRSQLEDAADEAECESTTAEDIRKLILDQTETMNRLASLTEAVQNGYVLHDYDEYNDWAKAESTQREQQQQMDADEILDQLDRMKFPNKQRPSRIPPPLPQREEEHINHSSQRDHPSSTDDDDDDASEKRKNGDGASSSTWGDSVAKISPAYSPGGTHYPIGLHQKPKPLNIRGHVLAIQHKMQIAKSRKKQRRKESFDADGSKKRKRKKGEDASSQSVLAINNDHRSKRKSLPSRLMEETGLVLRPPSKSPGTTMANGKPDDQTSTSVPQQQQQQQQKRLSSVPRSNTTKVGANKKRRKSDAQQAPMPKKCHNCKTTQAKYFKCRFVMPTGMRCGKTYCLECLDKDYDGQQQDDVDKEEWHCPACLGYCKCKPCCTQREKDRRREAVIQKMQRNKPTRQRAGVSRLT